MRFSLSEKVSTDKLYENCVHMINVMLPLLFTNHCRQQVMHVTVCITKSYSRTPLNI